MKFIIDNIIFIGIAVVSGGMLLWPLLTTRGKRASALEVTQMINRGKTVVVDLREQAEFAAGHLRDAKHIPLKELATRIGELDKFKSRTVVLVCQSGTRAGAATKVLEQAGFTDVVCLDGGVAGWQGQGLPVAKA